MKLIFAQGNPGTQYAKTRHNVGFMVLDALATQEGASWKTESKFNADIATIQLHGEKVLLVKPLSYYNETGQVARALADFYKLTPAEDILVIHDDLALPLGTIRIRHKGSDAGNNGIKSLNSHLGPDYTRIRVGIWSELRNQMDDVSFVVGAFSKDERSRIDTLIEQKILPLVLDFAKGALEATSHTAE